ncbi:hypothetical protein Angca_002537 [Angiostrongylus cantonensis]|nr:hypothetical protein Angca_002537 [Angiostrongylus cantonensis]
MASANDFCADSFWGIVQTIALSPPFPSECFSHTVLVGLPALFLCATFPVIYLQIKTSAAHVLPWTTLQSMKWLLGSLMVGNRVFLLLFSLWRTLFDFKSEPLVNLVYPIVQSIAMILVLVLMNESRKGGLSNPGAIFCTWLIFAVCGAPEFYAWIMIGSDQKLVGEVDFIQYVCYLAFYPLLLLQLILNCFSDPSPLCDKKHFEYTKTHPETSASFPNRQIFWWFSALISKASKKSLEVRFPALAIRWFHALFEADDLFELDDTLKANNLITLWETEWNKSIRDYEILKSTAELPIKEHYSTEKSPLFIGNGKKYGTTLPGDQLSEVIVPPSVIAVLWRLFKWELIGASVVKFLSDLLQFANPGFLSLLISFTEDRNVPLYQGIFYSVGLFICSILRSLLLNNYYTMMTRVGTKIQIVLTTAVYNKTLKLSNSSRRQKTHGEIVNLMAIDVDRFRLITPQLQQYWSSPLQVIVCMFLLWQTIGYAVIAGFFVMISVIPLNIGISFLSKQWTSQQMVHKDERIRKISEVLSGLKVVKLYAWEPAMEAVIDKIRVVEMALVRKAAVARTVADILNIATPFLVALVTFTTYTLLSSSNVLTPQIAFVSLTLFNQLRAPLIMAAELISQTIQVAVSNERLKEFLIAEELSETAVDVDEDGQCYSHSVDISMSTLAWHRHEPPQLQGINLKVAKGQLMAIVGAVGVGKSSLLLGILGEMEKVCGYIGRRGTFAYVPQQSWIRNTTLRDNIIMGKTFDRNFYERVIEACALDEDLKQLPNGDRTEIGEKGINLSGGQKARVALARAIYQDRDVYLLDDPLSAVDAHVSKHIFTNVIGSEGLLKCKTRILVTHALSFLKDTDIVVVMRGGSITHTATYDSLRNSDVSEIIQESPHGIEESPNSESSEIRLQYMPLIFRSNSDDNEDELDADEVRSVVSRNSRTSRESKKARQYLPVNCILKLLGLSITVKFSVYMVYLKSIGILRYFVPFVVALVLNSVFLMARNLWLSDWSNDNIPEVDKGLAKPLGIRLGIYALFGILEVVFLYLALSALILGAVVASLKLHKPLLHNILRSPLSHFDVTPLGRILNRLGKVSICKWCTYHVSLCYYLSFRISYVTLLCLWIEDCLSFSSSIMSVFQHYFIPCSRQLQRLTAISRSPIYSHFDESIQGATIIRAFGWINMFNTQNVEKVLERGFSFLYFKLLRANIRWLAVRLELLGSIVILATSLLAVMSRDWGTMSAGAIGLSVSYSLSITFMLNFFMRQLSEIETNIVAVERIKEYTETAVEAPWRCRHPPPIDWPRGEISIYNYSARYRPGLDLVIKDVTVHISPVEKIGLVGRTGSGKSSLVLALFRIIEPASGKILIDGVDITTIGLHDLRERLTIIPQDPVLFSGTLRFNLDPIQKHTDAELWSAIEHANLKHFVQSFPLGFQHQVDECGHNISAGQRQLICLTRALMRKSRLIVLDEATASVDSQTDMLIQVSFLASNLQRSFFSFQTTIRSQFSSSTIITIAHRLNTIFDYDRVLVMDAGRVAEFDTPQQLLARNSIFRSMAINANLM